MLRSLTLPITVPRAFGLWWLVWNQIDSDSFPLPGPLRDVPGLTTVNDDEDLAYLFVDDDDNETAFGSAIADAWHTIPFVDRDLMLFCWGAVHRAQAVRGAESFMSSEANRDSGNRRVELKLGRGLPVPATACSSLGGRSILA